MHVHVLVAVASLSNVGLDEGPNVITAGQKTAVNLVQRIILEAQRKVGRVRAIV